MSCINCGRGFHQECPKCRKGKCHSKDSTIKGAEKILRGEGRGRPLKDPNAMQDIHSTGRKRAALLFPIVDVPIIDEEGNFVLDENGKPKTEKPDCEWKGKKNCGGGKKPIIGCLDGKQQDRHHGPIKDPRHNELNNVHRICKACHTHWHAENDPIYNQIEYTSLPHAPEEATLEELAWNAVQWKNIRKNRVDTD